MPKYIPKLLEKMTYSPPKKPRHALHPDFQIIYGKHYQLAKIDDSPKLDSKWNNLSRSVIRETLYIPR